VDWEYGNTRVACMRGRLLSATVLARLAQAGSAAAMVAQLEREEDWTSIVRQVAPLGVDAETALEAAVERHRSARLAALLRFYAGIPARLVEALVMPLDEERLVALLRRRRAGRSAEEIIATLVPGALLDARALAEAAHGSTPEATLRPVVRRGVLEAEDADAIATRMAAGADPPEVEAWLAEAVERSRRRRAECRGRDADAVRAVLDREREDRQSIVVELGEGGAGLATLVQRATTLERLDTLAAAGRRDPLGVGAVAGYVAAIGAQAIRLRAVAARARGAWTAEDVAPYLAATRESAWHAWSS
jgi:hypothetical protein